jgi:hypothetical protein
MFNSFSGKDACKLLADGAQLVDVRSYIKDLFFFNDKAFID